MSPKNKFSPEDALNARATKEEKVARRQQKQARNLANFAVRAANKGKLDVSLPAKTTPRFVPYLGGTHDLAIYPLAKELLKKEGLGIEDYSVGYGDPEDRITIRVVHDDGAINSIPQPQFPAHPEN